MSNLADTGSSDLTNMIVSFSELVYSEESIGHYMIMSWRCPAGDRIWSLTFADHVSEDGRWAAQVRAGLLPNIEVEILCSHDSRTLSLPEWELEETIVLREVM